MGEASKRARVAPAGIGLGASGLVAAAKAAADPFDSVVGEEGGEAVRPLTAGAGGAGGLWYCPASELGQERQERVFELTKRHMAPIYGQGWRDAAKRRELFAPSARYVVSEGAAGTELLGFVHFRFVVDQGAAVVYVYELQVAEEARGRGLGTRLMGLMEALGARHGLAGVVLTVQHVANPKANSFYRGALGYAPHPLCPTQFWKGAADARGAPAYAILARWRDSAAVARLEEEARLVAVQRDEEDGGGGAGGASPAPTPPRRTTRRR